VSTAPRLRLAADPGLDRRLRVLFLIDSLGPGGAERLMVDLLPELQEQGIDSEVVAIQERHGNPVAAELADLGFSVSTIGIERLRERGALARVIDAVKASRPDVIHTQLEFANILGSIAGERLGIPTIATIHTLDRPAALSREGLRFRLMGWALRRRCDRVIAVSESARRHVLGRAGIRPRRTRAIHNGIDLAQFGPDADVRAAVRAELGISPSAFVVITVAVLRPPKGIGDMVRALPTVIGDHPDLMYLVVGDGSARGDLEALAEQLGVASVVNFAGHRADIPRMLAAADLFVLPSHTEALPTVLIEAMATELPVVATDVGGTSEILAAGQSGILVPPHAPVRLAEAVDRLASNPRQRRSMGLAGARIARERFSIQRHAGHLADEYRVLVAGGS
jgi:glycosyltransferase involved in cell wall biosynthesis